jgi:hypothetical protein
MLSVAELTARRCIGDVGSVMDIFARLDRENRGQRISGTGPAIFRSTGSYRLPHHAIFPPQPLI